MAKRIIIGVAFAISTFPAFTFAETVVLKSGKKVEGEIIERTQDYIKIDFQGVPVIYHSNEIRNIQPDSKEFSHKKESKQNKSSGDHAQTRTEVVAVAMEYIEQIHSCKTYKQCKQVQMRLCSQEWTNDIDKKIKEFDPPMREWEKHGIYPVDLELRDVKIYDTEKMARVVYSYSGKDFPYEITRMDTKTRKQVKERGKFDADIIYVIMLVKEDRKWKVSATAVKQDIGELVATESYRN